jgi:hypothetical protein
LLDCCDLTLSAPLLRTHCSCPPSCTGIIEGIAAATQLTHLGCALKRLDTADLDDEDAIINHIRSIRLLTEKKLPQMQQLRRLSLACGRTNPPTLPMQWIAGTFCRAMEQLTQLRSLNLVGWHGLTAQHVKEHICRLTRIEQLGLQYDYNTEPEPQSEEWDSEAGDWIDVPKEEDALSAVANSLTGLRSLTLDAYDNVVESTMLPWIESCQGLFHLQHLAFVIQRSRDPQPTQQLLERLAAARPGLSCAWDCVQDGLIAPFVGEL